MTNKKIKLILVNDIFWKVINWFQISIHQCFSNADLLFLFFLHDKETREVEETKKLPKHLATHLQKI